MNTKYSIRQKQFLHYTFLDISNILILTKYLSALEDLIKRVCGIQAEISEEKLVIDNGT